MNRLRFVVALALAVGGLLSSHTNGLAHTAAIRPQQQSGMDSPVLGLRPAVVMDPLPAMAWTVRHEAGHRVVAAVPAGDAPRVVGPTYAGNDGAPALVSTQRGLLLVAARRDDEGSHLWSRRWGSGSWSRVERVPGTGPENHHPAAAANNEVAWVVWVAGQTAAPRPGDPLVAARWDGLQWSSPERLPTAPGEPMAPAIALDKLGRPTVVWAAGDGNDAEVWLSRRTGAGRWSEPRALTDNDVPDIQPSIARTATGRLLAAWSTFTPIGYEIRASIERGGRFTRPRSLAPAPANSPKVVEGGREEVLWSIPMVTGESRLRSATFGGRRGRRAIDLATLYNGRFDASLGPDGAALAIWQSPTGPARIPGSTDDAGRLRLDVPSLETVAPVSAHSTVPGGLSIPGTWRSLGDSITEGVLVDENMVITPTDGFTVPLGNYLSSFSDRLVVVANNGVGGEETVEGLARLAALMAIDPRRYVTLLMGANDVGVLVDTATIVTNLTAMVRLVTGAGCLPLLGKLTPRREAAFIGGINPRINEVNARLPAMAAAEGALLVDLHSILFNKYELYSDFVHPNQRGYDLIAATWFRAIAPLWKRIIEAEDTENDIDRDGLVRPRSRLIDLDQ
ncbi:MAG TPA: GDSL-type esterase/lipase family protein [Acidobacteriota bacterium]|nr:GDSL-type esterase/lipase family protein [Acidobacteriota bacterium]